MKSTQKTIITVLIGSLLVLACGLVAQDDSGDDPVLEYYRSRAEGQTDSRNPLVAGVQFSLTGRTFLSEFDRKGDEEVKDSAIFTNYYSFGELDSQAVVLSSKDGLSDIDITFPNVFAADYHFRFYPNDTGGADLAIGFESDSGINLTPVGLAVIDRTRYFPRRFYLYYPNEERYERYSRVISLREQDGFIFPDTITTFYAVAGIFSIDHYRLDTYIDSVKIMRE